MYICNSAHIDQSLCTATVLYIYRRKKGVEQILAYRMVYNIRKTVNVIVQMNTSTKDPSIIGDVS